ncbi:DHA2 family efflux MFS transporter permease subunit [Goodfellowiella coeruleoviolacea]|uniref:Drug resistance transporter, EmrB/QacA subfamily n=1 Tax=Goodfellowiella coeruleoviolacea TaxID=334858 RepID=A0AAE3GBV2_9PSEU|nr:DHA2 family efflux MFS transporter permease subunit [Goodfellowiella coeruleoviolacea]MCP2165422.1 drug resistance transporter, EmrB/QacA subfamily [Goodfellowiella coeruleoviolacea]
MSARPVNPWAALVTLCLGYSMIVLDSTIVNVAVPAMLTGLPASLNEVIWVNSGYLLAFAVPLLVAGRLGDRFGPRRVFLVGLAVFTLASLWCGLAGGVSSLVAARAVQGLGAALLMPQTMALITHLFPAGRRGAAMGVWGSVIGVATISGPLLGGLLVQTLGWEWIFFINLPIGVVSMVLTVVLVPDWRPGHGHRFDLLGVLLSCAGLLALVFGLQNGQHYHWSTVTGGVTITGIIVLGLVLLVGFVVWQAVNRAEPLLPLRLFASRDFSLVNLANLALGCTMGGVFVPLMLYLQSALGYSPLLAGVISAPMSLAQGLVAPFVGRLADRLGGRFLAAGGFLLFAAGLAVLAWQVDVATNPVTLVPAMLVCGVGMAGVFSPLATMATTGLDPRLVGAGSGVFNTSRQVGSVLGSAAVGVLLQARLSVSVPDAIGRAAAALPESARDAFVSGVGQAAASAGEFTAPHVPDLPGLPAEWAGQAARLAETALHAGLTSAAKATLVLPVGVLVLGALCCLGLRGRRGGRRGDQPAPAVAGPEAALSEATPSAAAPDTGAPGTGAARATGVARASSGEA